MLIIWTDADDDTFREVVIPPLQKLRKGIEYKKMTFNKKEDSVYLPKKGEYVLAMGAGTLDALKKNDITVKNLGLEKQRETIIESPKGGAWIITYSPYVIKKEPSKVPLFHWDLVLIDRYSRTKSLEPIIGEYEWVEDFSETIQYIKDKYEHTGKPVDVALDTETVGLYPWYEDKGIVCVQITVEVGQAQVVYTLGHINIGLIIEQLDWLLNTDKVSLKGANLKYDLLWLRVKWGLTCANFKMDTLLVGSLIDENRSNSLSNHVKEYAPDLGGYDSTMNTRYDKGRMDLIPKEDLLTYAGGDTDGDLRVAIKERELLKDNPKLGNFYVNLLHPASRVFEDIEYHGLIVDRKEMAKVKNMLEAKIDECHREILNLFPRKLKMKYADKENLFTPAIIKQYLFSPYGLNLKPKMTTPTGLPTIKEDHLKMFTGVPEAAEFLKWYKELNSASKSLSTYVVGFAEHIRPDGRFHPSYALYKGDLYGSGGDEAGTNTGRLSAQDPAVQTIPKRTKWAKHLRRCYPAPEGYDFWQIDYSEGELRVAACIADEPRMIEAYNKGLSLHAKTGALLSGRDIEGFLALKEEDKDLFSSLRTKAKAANFGLLYGLQAQGYKEYARVGFELELTMAEAEEHRRLFFDAYPELEIWHTRFTNMAHRYGEVESPLGRVRHLPLIHSNDWKLRSKAERQAINAPVQGCLSDLCLLGAVYVRQRFTPKEVWIAGMTHDSLYGYIPKEHTMERLREMKYIMENLPLKQKFNWEPQIPFIVDAEVGPNMADLEEVDL